MVTIAPQLQFALLFVSQMRFLAKEEQTKMDVRNPLYAYRKKETTMVIYVQFTVQQSAEKMKYYAKGLGNHWDVRRPTHALKEELKQKGMLLEVYAMAIAL